MHGLLASSVSAVPPTHTCILRMPAAMCFCRLMQSRVGPEDHTKFLLTASLQRNYGVPFPFFVHMGPSHRIHATSAARKSSTTYYKAVLSLESASYQSVLSSPSAPFATPRSTFGKRARVLLACQLLSRHSPFPSLPIQVRSQ